MMFPEHHQVNNGTPPLGAGPEARPRRMHRLPLAAPRPASKFAGETIGPDSHRPERGLDVPPIPEAPSRDDPIRLEPIGNGLFRYVAPTGGGPVGEVVRFVEENGRVVRMITGDS